MHEIFGLKHVLSTFQETVWSHLKGLGRFASLFALQLSFQLSTLSSLTDPRTQCLYSALAYEGRVKTLGTRLACT